MKKIILLMLTLFVLVSFVNASNIEDFPDIFVDAGRFDGIIVVGNEGSASDVIAQSNLIQFFSGYTGKGMLNTAKLADEVVDLEQNIISIGRPCTNKLTRKILGNPKPCDKNLKSGQIYIYLYEYKKYNYLLVFGYDDILTKKGVDFLVNYDTYDLEDNEIVLDSNGKIISSRTKNLVYLEQEEIVENETIIPEINITKALEEKLRAAENKTELKLIPNETEIKIEPKIEENKPQINETKIITKIPEKGIFSKLIDWIKSLFG